MEKKSDYSYLSVFTTSLYFLPQFTVTDLLQDSIAKYNSQEQALKDVLTVYLIARSDQGHQENFKPTVLY